MKVVVLDDYQEAVKDLNCFSLLNNHNVTVINKPLSLFENFPSEMIDAEVLVLIRERTQIDDDLLKKLTNLKLISQTGKISSHISLKSCNKYGIPVAEGIGSPVAPAELTWALIMNVQRRIPQALSDMKKGLWQTNIGYTLQGAVLGIWGYGKIGRRIAGYAKAFDMKVLVWGSQESMEKAKDDGCLTAKTKEEFFLKSDIITLHLRLVPSTTGIVKLSDLMLMKHNAVLVNTARAELIEKGALVKALQSGRPGFAALDVFENEPLYDKNHPLLLMHNVICTPHLGYVEKNGYELYFSKAFQNINEFAIGNPVNIVNPETLG